MMVFQSRKAINIMLFILLTLESIEFFHFGRCRRYVKTMYKLLFVMQQTGQLNFEHAVVVIDDVGLLFHPC